MDKSKQISIIDKKGLKVLDTYFASDLEDDLNDCDANPNSLKRLEVAIKLYSAIKKEDTNKVKEIQSKIIVEGGEIKMINE